MFCLSVNNTRKTRDSSAKKIPVQTGKLKKVIPQYSLV